MSSEDSKEVSGSVPSIISPDLKIVGDLKCTGDIQIDGTIEGSVTGGLIIIGEQAKVEGSIVAETVRIFGTVNGRVRAKTVHLDKTGKVIGDTGVCLREIGRMMGRSASTISRELAGQADYGRPQLNPAKPEPTRRVRHGFVWAVGFLRRGGERFWR